MLASSLSRRIPALWMMRSSPPCRARACSAIWSAARGSVTSNCSADPPTSLITSAKDSPACGTSTPITVAPSRASTRTISAPIPRAAPVTTATFPASGWVASAENSPTPVTTSGWPSTKADRPENKKRSVPMTEGAATGTPPATMTELAVAPARSSLATDRMKPSNPPRAADCSWLSASSAGRDTTMTLPLGIRCFKAAPSSRAGTPAGVANSVATTRAAPQRPSPIVSARRRTSRSRLRSAAASVSASGRESGSEMTRTGPGRSGAPGWWRRSSTGRGRPSLFATALPGPEFTNEVYRSITAPPPGSSRWPGRRRHTPRAGPGRACPRGLRTRGALREASQESR